MAQTTTTISLRRMSRSAILAALTLGGCRSEPAPIARDPAVTKPTTDADVEEVIDTGHHVGNPAPIYGTAPPPPSVHK